MKIDYTDLLKNIIGASIPRPISGTISGHAAGEPFDKHAYQILKEKYPDITFRHYEFLNELYSRNPQAKDELEKFKLIGPYSAQYLLNRGKKATKQWSTVKLFEEKQNDTADIILSDNGFYEIIDVKTKNLSKKAQPPNIISSEKLAFYSKLALENNEYEHINIVYLGIDWQLEGDRMVCKHATIKHLFKAKPSTLYINWSAALQLQFHVEELDQSYTGSVKDWCEDYLKHYVKSRKKHIEKTIEKKIKPFEPYV